GQASSLSPFQGNAEENSETGRMPVLRRAWLQSRRLTADHFGRDGAAAKLFGSAHSQIFAVANNAGGLSARFADICERGRRTCATHRRNAGVVVSETPRVGNGIWPPVETGFERTASAGSGSDCVR